MVYWARKVVYGDKLSQEGGIRPGRCYIEPWTWYIDQGGGTLGQEDGILAREPYPRKPPRNPLRKNCATPLRKTFTQDLRKGAAQQPKYKYFFYTIK